MLFTLISLFKYQIILKQNKINKKNKKKLILVCTLFTIYLGSFAQTDSTRKKIDYDMDNNNQYNNQKNNQNNNQDQNKNKNTSNQYQKKDSASNDCTVRMENGKMMMVVDGKTVVMDKQMTTKNGAIVMMDGTVKRKDGKTVKMKNGECMDMSDKIIVVKNNQIKEDRTNASK